jgi:hypothetical protein
MSIFGLYYLSSYEASCQYLGALARKRQNKEFECHYAGAILVKYQHRLDSLEEEFCVYQEHVKGYKESVKHSFGDVTVHTQDAIHTAVQHLPNQLQQLIGNLQSLPPPIVNVVITIRIGIDGGS